MCLTLTYLETRCRAGQPPAGRMSQLPAASLLEPGFKPRHETPPVLQSVHRPGILASETKQSYQLIFRPAPGIMKGMAAAWHSPSLPSSSRGRNRSQLILSKSGFTGGFLADHADTSGG